MLLYADDLKVFRAIDTVADCLKFESDIKSLLLWCNNNHLFLNFSKCKVVTFTRKHFPVLYNYTYANGLQFIRENCVKDLGIYFDSCLTFKDHMDYITSKANSVFGFLKRNSKNFSNAKTITVLFESLVRSHLEYVSIIWSPYYDVSINRIEKIQKRFTRFALRNNFSFDNMPVYESRCDMLGIKTLKSRSKLQSILFIKDILDSNIDSPDLLNLLPFLVPPRQLRDHHLFALPYHRTNYGTNEPLTRCLRLFNNVANSVDINLGKQKFKKIVLQIIDNV